MLANCSNPRIILRKDSAKVANATSALSVDGRLLHIKHGENLYNYRPAKASDLDKVQVVSANGTLTPLFMEVPCGHCRLCQNKRSSEWACRATIESNYSKYYPLFVTLTYNEDTLPECGVSKDEIQRFLKRLRKNLAEAYPYPCNKKYCDEKGLEFRGLRYIACGEYGKQTQRAHYHVCFFDFPENSLVIAKSIIDDAWTLGKKNFGFTTISRIGWNDPNKKSKKSCAKSAARYAAKYVGKGAFCPKGKNLPFMLASRGRGSAAGIGSQYLQDNKLLYNQLQISVRDKFTSEVLTFGVPRYFERKVYPSLSQYLKKHSAKMTRLTDIIHNLSVLETLDPFKETRKYYYDAPFWTKFHSVVREIQYCCGSDYLPSLRPAVFVEHRRTWKTYLQNHPTTVCYVESPSIVRHGDIVCNGFVIGANTSQPMPSPKDENYATTSTFDLVLAELDNEFRTICIDVLGLLHGYRNIRPLIPTLTKAGISGRILR